jgi:hypothetical protein
MVRGQSCQCVAGYLLTSMQWDMAFTHLNTHSSDMVFHLATEATAVWIIEGLVLYYILHEHANSMLYS